MAELIIRDVPAEEIGALERRAARRGRTLEAEARHLLHEAAREELMLAELDRATAAVESRIGAKPESGTARSAPRRRYRSVEPTPRSRPSR
jgi:plasmid stability protein